MVVADSAVGVLGFLDAEAAENHVAVKRVVGIHVDDIDVRDAQGDELLDVVGVQSGSGLEDLCVLSVDLCIDVLCRVHSVKLFLGALVELHGLGCIECGNDLFTCIVSDSSEEERTENSLLSVDFRTDYVLFLIDLELEPGAAVRDDARGVDTLLVGEDDTGGSVDLADDDTLRAVDDEGSPVRHEGDVAEEDLLLPEFVVCGKMQTDDSLELDTVCASLLLALRFGILDVVEIKGIGLITESHFLVRAVNREY